MGKLWVVIIFFTISLIGLSEDHIMEMQNLILTLSQDAKIKNRDFSVILQNPKDVLFEGNDKVLESTSGVTVEEYFYGYPKIGKVTPKYIRDEHTATIERVERSNKKIFYIDYIKPDQYNEYLKTIEGAKESNALFYPSFSIKLNTIDTIVNNPTDIDSFEQVKTFTYLINPSEFKTKALYFEGLKKCYSDIIFIDLQYKGKPLTQSEVEYLKTSDLGTKRLIIAYLSIGEAESYRGYWDSEWNTTLPDWIVTENSNWSGNYIVKYWSQEWYNIVREQLSNIVDVGFSGVVFDTLDSYEYFK